MLRIIGNEREKEQMKVRKCDISDKTTCDARPGTTQVYNPRAEIQRKKKRKSRGKVKLA